jgi:integrase
LIHVKELAAGVVKHRAIYPKDPEEHQVKYPELQQMLQDQYDLAATLIDTGLRHTELTEGLWHSVDTVNFSSLNFYREKVGSEGYLVCTSRLSAILERRFRRFGNSPYIFPARHDPMKPRG